MKPVYSVCAFLVNWTELNTPTHPSRKFIFIADIFSFLKQGMRIYILQPKAIFENQLKEKFMLEKSQIMTCLQDLLSMTRVQNKHQLLNWIFLLTIQWNY